MKFIIKYIHIIILCIIFIIFIFIHKTKEYQLYKKYNNMSGIVLSSFYSRTCIILTVKLKDGTITSINNGAYNLPGNSIWYNQLDYNWLFGISGFAHSYIPNEAYYHVVNALFASIIIISIFSTMLLIIYLCYKYTKYIEKNF